MSTTDKAGDSPLDKLSPREWQVAEAIWSEASDKQIVAGLGISQSTLRTHLTRVLVKLDVVTRVGIARQFERWRVVRNADGRIADMRLPAVHRKVEHEVKRSGARKRAGASTTRL